MSITINHTVDVWVFIYFVLSLFVVALMTAVLVTVGDYVSDVIEEHWRVRVLGQQPRHERLKAKK